MAYRKTYRDREENQSGQQLLDILQMKREWFQMEEDGLLGGDDPAEQEADQAAKQIVSGDGIDATDLGTVDSQSQGKVESHAISMENSISGSLAASKGGGHALEDGVKAEMEEQMNTNLSDVRIHNDANANQMSEDINARAFTHGQDIYFKDGNFDTQSKEGKELLAHELVHTKQQDKGTKRKVQRAVKLEFQTGNYLWKVKKTKTSVSASLLPRKWGREGKTDEDGTSPIYLALGKHGDPGVSKAEKGDYIPLSKPDFVTTMARTNSMVKASGYDINPSLPAQYVVIVLVKDLARYVINESIPSEEDVIVLTTYDRRPSSIMLKEKSPWALKEGQFNPGTYEFKYYNADTFFQDHPNIDLFDWNQEKKMANNPSEYLKSVTSLPTYLVDNTDYENVHRDEQGVFRRGHIKLMQEKETEYAIKKSAQYLKEYEFKSQVSLDDILDKKVSNDQLIERIDKRVDNSEVFEEGMYYPQTFNIKYFNADGTELPIHVDKEAVVRKGARELMKVEEEIDDREAKNAQFFQEIVVRGINSEQEVIGKNEIELSGEISGFSVEEGEMTENPGNDIAEGTYNFIYLTEDGKWLNVHRDAQGVFRLKYVPLLRKAKKDKKAKEQTAIELQSETGGYVEFETPKWFRIWSDLKLRVEDAVAMTKTISNSEELKKEDPENKKLFDFLGKAAVHEKDKEENIIKSGTGAIGRSGRKVEQKEEGETPRIGKLVKWPKSWPTDDLDLAADEELIVEIVSEDWPAKIQFSEGIELSQFGSLLKQHEQDEAYVKKFKELKPNLPKTDFVTPSIQGMEAVWEDVVRYIGDENVLKNEPLLKGSEEKELNDLKGFILLISSYLTRGQGTYVKGDPSKFGFRLMARTGFYSMYQSLLNPQEQIIFKYLVEENVFIMKMSDILTEVAKEMYLEEYKHTVGNVSEDDYVIRHGYGSKHHTRGPKIGDWLESIYEGGGSHPTDGDIETDLMSRPVGGSASMGRFEVEDDYGQKDTGLVRFEVRGSTSGTVVDADKWVSWVEERFKYAAENRSRTDLPDDPTTPDVNESTSTGLVYD